MKSKLDKSFKEITKFTSQMVNLNDKANSLLSQVVQGLKQMCNHCVIKDCEYCWANDICKKITNYFENIPPMTQKNLKVKKTPSPNQKRYTLKF